MKPSASSYFPRFILTFVVVVSGKKVINKELFQTHINSNGEVDLGTMKAINETWKQIEVAKQPEDKLAKKLEPMKSTTGTPGTGMDSIFEEEESMSRKEQTHACKPQDCDDTESDAHQKSKHTGLVFQAQKLLHRAGLEKQMIMIIGVSVVSFVFLLGIGYALLPRVTGQPDLMPQDNYVGATQSWGLRSGPTQRMQGVPLVQGYTQGPYPQGPYPI